VTTNDDPQKRATVFDLLPKKFKTLHPVGRLDFDTAGVLLLTDDGELTHLLTHPSHGVEKIYHVRVGGEVKTETLKKLAAGVWIAEGAGEERNVKTLPCRVKVKAQTDNNALVEITLREGRNRQVRKMMEAAGHPVSALRRISFGGIELEGLASGAFRILLPGEVHELKKRAARQVEKAKKERAKETGQPEASKAKPHHGAKPGKPHTAKNKPPARKPKPKGAATPMGERIRREWK
jgi:pseudouridine synthase